MILKDKATPESIAGVAVEFVQGENGVQIPPPEWPKRLFDLCKKYGWILYNDGVQEGVGRTGTFFAIEHWPQVEGELLPPGEGPVGRACPCRPRAGRRREAAPARKDLPRRPFPRLAGGLRRRREAHRGH